MPHLMTLAHGRLGAPAIEQVRKALLSFQKTPAGETFFRDTGYNGYVAVTPDDIEKLRPFVDLTVQMMR
jgi:ABC-type phosphate/phosphonate transport system substrate-binding protein